VSAVSGGDAAASQGVAAGAAAALSMIASLNAGIGTGSGGMQGEQQGNESTIGSEEQCVVGSAGRHAVMQRLMKARSVPSTCVVLRNMVGVDDVDDELEKEVTEECSRHGGVESVAIHNDTRLKVVKIFVKYQDVHGGERAIAALNNRWFGGRQITAEAYPEDKFAQRDFSG